jgi:hypothetical protein
LTRRRVIAARFPAITGFLGHAGQVERTELVGDFTATTTTVMATVNVEDILRSGGQGP